VEMKSLPWLFRVLLFAFSSFLLTTSEMTSTVMRRPSQSNDSRSTLACRRRRRLLLCKAARPPFRLRVVFPSPRLPHLPMLASPKSTNGTMGKHSRWMAQRRLNKKGPVQPCLGSDSLDRKRWAFVTMYVRL
jgi:hypothetical protein